ncbi:MAG: ABC transporter ATP-binding protein [Bdellovibrionales bacterium]|nr:ABC transporter ATP-binding protein [Bdellovibrionales bacterium]
MQSILEIKNLKFSWPGSSAPLLDIESLQVDKGESVFLQGASGSGKSTLLNLIGGVLVPQEGSVEVLSKDLVKMTAAERDQFRGDHMGFIFQMFNLLPYFSAMENATLPCQFSKVKKARTLASGGSVEAEATRLFAELKLGPDVLKMKNVTQLSVGQQQRVAAVRALIGKPEIVIADEPTSALDADIRDRFIELLFLECEKIEASLLFVSHDQSLSSRFDRTIRLSDLNRASQAVSSDRELGGSL